MAAHRYWRLSIAAVVSGSYVAVTQLRFFASASPGSEVPATGGTASASAIYGAGYNADKAFDGDAATYWYAALGTPPAWLKYDFGSGNDKTVTGFTLRGGYAVNTSSAPKDFALQYSDDNATWSDAIAVSNELRWNGGNTNFYGVDTVGRALTYPLIRADAADGGAFRVRGTVTELGVAGPYRVRLFDRLTARCIRETRSAADGSYSFPRIAYRDKGYFVVAYDHGDSPHNAAIADLVTPEPMP